MASKYATANIGEHPRRLRIHQGGMWAEVPFEKVRDLRYGENPRETAALYGTGLLASAEMVRGGKDGPSWINMQDMDAGLSMARYLDDAVVITKHTHPCGVAMRRSGEPSERTYRRAWNEDYISSFGNVVSLTLPLTRALAEEIARTFTEVIIAPEIEKGALEPFDREGSKSKSTRVFRYDAAKLAALPKFVGDAFEPGVTQLQTGGIGSVDPHLTAMQKPGDLLPYLRTSRHPSTEELRDLLVGLYLNMRAPSNSCVFVREQTLVGVGQGQNSALFAVMNAIAIRAYLDDHARVAMKEQELGFSLQERAPGLAGSALARDAFAPFPDAPLMAAEAGVKTMLFIEGGDRFKDVVKAMEDRGVSYIALPPEERHFRH